MGKRISKAAKAIGVSELKTHCLSIVEEVRERGSEYVVTKRGEPVARLVPVDRPSATLYGALKGQIEIVGDIVSCDWSEEFDALRQ